VSGAKGAVRTPLRPHAAPFVLAPGDRPTARRRRALFAVICAVVVCELLVIAAVGTVRARGGEPRDAPAAQTAARDAGARTPVAGRTADAP
jgi:hypothetical protein